MKNTRQRQAILKVFKTKNKHMNAEQVYEQVHKIDATIGLATVYRNLNLLSEQNLITRVNHPNLGYLYDGNIAPHYHAYCTTCGKLFDVYIPMVEGINEQAEQANGFKVDTHDIIFEGTCRACQSKKIH